MTDWSGEEEPVAWLRAQIEARLALAREASPKTDGHWWRRTADIGHDVVEPVGPLWAGVPVLDVDGDVFGGDYIVVYDEGAPSDAQFDHIAANDPQDTIARCEAELAILDDHGGEHMCFENSHDGNTWSWYIGDCRIMRMLASGYKYRPGYRVEDWKQS